MPHSILTNLKKFRDKLYRAIEYRADACMDVIDSLCSNATASSPVQLSLNPLHRRTYNSITDVVTEFDKGGVKQERELLKILTEQALNNNEARNYYLLATDCTCAPRVYSNTLADRSIVYAPNPIAGNKPITIGHKYSITGFLPPKDSNSAPWILPLITQRVPSSKNDVMLGAEQVQTCVNYIAEHNADKLFINLVDSGYCKAEYIDKLHNAKNVNLVTIVRARANRVVWRKSSKKHSIYSGKRGHELWYGDKFDFKSATTWHEAEYNLEKTLSTKNGKNCSISIQAWENMVMRTKNGIAMHNNIFTLYRIMVFTQTGKQLYRNPLWLMVFGDRRKELSLEQVYQNYLQRYDIEHFFKFYKNNLLVDKLQTSNVKHEENWWTICGLAYSILFASRLTVEKNFHPWEKYLPQVKSQTKEASASQVQRAFYKLTCTIGTPALAPKPRGKPLGRQFGDKQVKRSRYQVIIKRKKAA